MTSKVQWKELFAKNSNFLNPPGERREEIELNPTVPYCLQLQAVEGIHVVGIFAIWFWIIEMIKL